MQLILFYLLARASHIHMFYLMEKQTNVLYSIITGLHHVKYGDLIVLLAHQSIHLLQRRLMVHQQ
jgi:hypothetical protein